MKFSSTLKELREQNHVTQNQLASHLKLTHIAIGGTLDYVVPDIDR